MAKWESFETIGTLFLKLILPKWHPGLQEGGEFLGTG